MKNTRKKDRNAKNTRKHRIRKDKTHTNKACVYSENDFNSNDGMLTTVWGPAMWHYLHTMSFNYPVNPMPEDKVNYMNFILNMQNVLPCGKCRKNLKKNLKKLPITNKHMDSRATFSKYVYDLHEVINGMLGKNSGLSYDDVRERYEHFRARCAYTLKDIEKVVMTGGEKEKEKEKEKGCTEPLYGEKSKCVIHIVPQTDATDTFEIDEKCIKHKNL